MRQLAILAALLFLGCAARVQPVVGPLSGIEAHLDAMPPITIAGHLVTLHAWLDDPKASVLCPGVEWTWPNGTRSSQESDCDPDEKVTRHSDTKQGVLPAGDHTFKVTFASEGHSWSATRTVEVH